MNIVIVGQGAMGLLWYHHIQQLIKNHANYSQTQLHLLSSDRTASSKLASNKSRYIKTNTLCDSYAFTEINNSAFQDKINYAQTQNIQAADFIILCLKSFQISSALKKLSVQIKSNASIVLAHNGMGTLTELPQTIVQLHNIYTLLTTHGCLRTAPLSVTHTGVGVSDIGLVSGYCDIAQQQALTKLLMAALPRVTFHKEIKQKQWLKLAVNCVINPLTAINDINNGQVTHVSYLPIITALLEEIVAVANAEEIILSLNELTQTVAKVASETAKNSSSMRCDILAKRPTEIDYINGYIHRLGIKHDIATPENTKMWQTVKNLEFNNRS